MVSFSVIYEGNFHCSATHGPSKSTIATDAPKDNHGRGETFSPTDLATTALGTCMMTTIAILTRTDNIPLTGMRAEVEKHMTSTAPRRIAKMVVTLHMPAGIAADARPRLKEIAHNCPVALSLHPDVQQVITFHYPD